MITPRDYQIKCIDDCRSFFASGGKHAIVTSATGSGKTVIFTLIAKQMAEKNKKVLIFTNRVELLSQAGGSLKKVGLNSFFIQAGCKIYNNSFNCFIAMSQTFRRRIEENYWKEFLKAIDLVIIDECHLQEFNYLFESGLLNGKYVLGFTATPKRTGKMRQLGLDFEKIIKTISIKELIKRGYLVNCDLFSSIAPDLSGVAYDRMKGDYQETSLFHAFNKPKLYAGAVKNYKEITPGTKALVFCVNIQHCILTCKEFNDNGIVAKYIVSSVSKPKEPIEKTDANMSIFEERMKIYNLYLETFNIFSGDRKYVFNWFENTKGAVLINAGIATTGYDCPSIETIIQMTATLSTQLHLQILGRGSRPYDGKTHFNILDFGSNSQRLGMYDEEREWHLWHDEKKGEGVPPVKICGYKNNGSEIKGNKKGCKRMIHASYTICPFCGFVYPEKTISEIDLQTIMQEAGKSIKTKAIKHMSFDELYSYFKSKNHNTTWLWRQLYHRGGLSEVESFHKHHGWSKNSFESSKRFIENMLVK